MPDRAADWSLTRAVEEGFEGNPWVYRAVNHIAWHQSRLRFRFATVEGDPDGEKELEDHPWYPILNGRANPLESGPQFRKRLSAQVLLSKRGAFIEPTFSRGGRLIRADLLDPERIRPIAAGNDLLDRWEFTALNGEVRSYAPSELLWVRDPHPTDPYSGVTPLEPAGDSVSLDVAARRYNRRFLDRDGRPGTLLAVEGATTEAELDRLEARFKPGWQEAGNTTVVSGAVTAHDLAAKPRDMAYGELAKASKLEILETFGVPESVLGDSSTRTYANSLQEELNFWLHTMLNHLAVISAAFEDNDLDEYRPGFDLSVVDALEEPQRMRREEAREEVEKGLRSLDEYRVDAGLGAFDHPMSRATYLPNGKVPVPRDDADAEILGVNLAVPADEVETAASAGGGVDQVVAPGGAEGTEPADGAQPAQAGEPGQTATDLPEPVVPGVYETKAADAGEPDTRDEQQDEQVDTASDELAAILTAILAAYLARQHARTEARAHSPQLRAGTPYWQPAGPDDTRAGTAPLDVDRVTQPEVWQQELDATLEADLSAEAAAAAAALVAVLLGATTAEQATSLLGDGVVAASTAGWTFTGPHRAAITGPVVLGVLTAAADIATGWVDRTKDALRYAETTMPGDLDALDRSLADTAERNREQVPSVAADLARAVVNGARDAAAGWAAGVPGLLDRAGAAAGVGVRRVWRTRRDDRVRDTHRVAEGQRVGLSEPFQVGGWPLRFPGDPLAPPALTRNCRCRVHYTVGRVT